MSWQQVWWQVSTRGRRRVAAAAAALVVTSSLAACTGEPEPDPAPSPTDATSSAAAPAPPLDFGVFGPPDELAAWERVVAEWNATDPAVPARLLADRSASSVSEEIAAGDLPDVFLATSDQLPELLAADLLQPLGEPLDARGVDFGDGYSRDALQAFSAEDDLQCMPFGISPTVLFVNTDLVDPVRMAARGLPVPSSPTEWDFEEFAAAARFATRPRRGVRGVHVPPTLDGLRPWVLAGGGEVYDDEEPPTSLTLSSEESQAALETLLTLLRAPQVTPTPEELGDRSAVELFEQGRLAMLPGERALVPQLRRVQGLSFDVRQLPRLDGTVTTGTVTGLCAAADADTDAVADFLLHLLDPDSVAAVAREGYLVPAELAVAASDAFLQPGRQPSQSQVFLDAVRDIVPAPELGEPGTGAALDAVVAPALRSMLYDAVIELDELTASIDASSQTVLGPEVDPASPEATPEG